MARFDAVVSSNCWKEEMAIFSCFFCSSNESHEQKTKKQQTPHGPSRWLSKAKWVSQIVRNGCHVSGHSVLLVLLLNSKIYFVCFFNTIFSLLKLCLKFAQWTEIVCGVAHRTDYAPLWHNNLINKINKRIEFQKKDRLDIWFWMGPVLIEV